VRVTNKLWALAQILLMAGGLAGGGSRPVLAQTPSSQDKKPHPTIQTSKINQTQSVSLSALEKHIENQVGFLDLTLATENSVAASDEDRALLHAFSQNARAMGMQASPVVAVFRKEKDAQENTVDAAPNAYCIQMENEPAVVGFSAALISLLVPEVSNEGNADPNPLVFFTLLFPPLMDNDYYISEIQKTDPTLTLLHPKSLFPHIPEARKAYVFRLLTALDAHENAHAYLHHVEQMQKLYIQVSLAFKKADDKKRLDLRELNERKQSDLKEAEKEQRKGIEDFYKKELARLENRDKQKRTEITANYLKKLAALEKAADLLAVQTTKDPGGLRLALDLLHSAYAKSQNKTLDQYYAMQEINTHPFPQTRDAYLAYKEQHTQASRSTASLHGGTHTIKPLP